MSSTVTTQLPASRWVARTGVSPVQCQFRYDPSDPFAVTLDVAGGDAETATWTFDRALLADGIVGHAGEGAVRIWRIRSGDSIIVIALESGEVSTYLYVQLSSLLEFAAAVDDAVPAGSEMDHVDLDVELEALLGDSGK